MPSINMIAGRRAEKRRQQQNVRKLMYGIVAELVVALLVVTCMYLRLANVNSHIHDLAAEMDKLQPRVTQIQHLEQETARLAPKVATLDGAKADTLFWYNGLFAVTSSLPPKTWLTSLGTNGNSAATTPGAVSGADPTLILSGIAQSQSIVGQTMLQINQTPGLDHADLSFVQQQKIGQTDTVSFQMTVHLKPEPSAAAPGGATHVQKS